jgi:hypothetical protein
VYRGYDKTACVVGGKGRGGRIIEMSVALELRPETHFRRLLVATVSVYCLFMLFMVVTVISHGSPLAVLPIVGGSAAVGVIIGTWYWRMAGVYVIGDATELTVRNVLAKHRIPRRRISSFRVGGSRFEFAGRAVRVVLDDHSTVVLMATGSLYLSRGVEPEM